ncbi:serine acetyltransferase [Marinovum sp.]|uniref:serine acetyltransferase n=1 Tax=Marinovum sp. TaxID=2024839 RepID=UPI003A92916A
MQQAPLIRSKEAYRAWVKADLEAARLAGWRFGMGLRHPTVHFLRVLRRVEYRKNCPPGPLGRLERALLLVYFRLLSIYLGFTIPPNTCGPGLRLNHWGTIVISAEARLGAGAHINVCVNIGLKNGKAPHLGDDVYIGPGAKLFGGIRLGDGVRIGANAVVTCSFPDNAILAGVPARVIGDRTRKTRKQPPQDEPG